MSQQTADQIALSNIDTWLDELPRIRADIEKAKSAKGIPQLKLKRMKNELEFLLEKIANE